MSHLRGEMGMQLKNLRRPQLSEARKATSQKAFGRNELKASPGLYSFLRNKATKSSSINTWISIWAEIQLVGNKDKCTAAFFPRLAFKRVLRGPLVERLLHIGVELRIWRSTPKLVTAPPMPAHPRQLRHRSVVPPSSPMWRLLPPCG